MLGVGFDSWRRGGGVMDSSDGRCIVDMDIAITVGWAGILYCFAVGWERLGVSGEDEMVSD
jgi:hypothetical protein